MATNQRNTRAAVKAQLETAAAATPQTRSKTTSEATTAATSAKATKTATKATKTTTNGVAQPSHVGMPDSEAAKKKLPPRCLACTRISAEDVRHHHTKCPVSLL